MIMRIGNKGNELATTTKKYMFHNRYGFLVLFIVFLIEYLLFRNCSYRMVIGKVPRNSDQITYMQCAYELYNAIVHRSWNIFFDLINERIYTSGIPLIGVLSLFLFGNSYYSFLIINFAAFITAQITGSYAIYKITKKWAYVFVWAGIFAALESPFYWADGLLDFRPDFIALCLYTCWIAVYLIFLKFHESRYLKINAVFAGILIFCRMLTIFYIGGTLVIFEIFLSYYWTHIDESDESVIRRMEQGVYTLWDNILFYPKSLIKDHLGYSVFIFIVFCFVTAAGCYFSGRITVKLTELWIFTAISILLPLLILTLDEAKSPVVVNIVSGSVVLASVICFYVVFDKYFKLRTACVIIICCLGITSYLGNSTQDKTGYSSEEQSGLININDFIADYIIHNEKQETVMFIDRTLDGINALASRYWLSVHGETQYDIYDNFYDYEYLHSNFINKSSVSEKPSEQEIEKQLEQADIIVVSENGYGSSLYSSDNEIDKYREKIWNYAVDNLNFMTEDYVYGTWVSVFAK